MAIFITGKDGRLSLAKLVDVTNAKPLYVSGYSEREPMVYDRIVIELIDDDKVEIEIGSGGTVDVSEIFSIEALGYDAKTDDDLVAIFARVRRLMMDHA